MNAFLPVNIGEKVFVSIAREAVNTRIDRALLRIAGGA